MRYWEPKYSLLAACCWLYITVCMALFMIDIVSDHAQKRYNNKCVDVNGNYVVPPKMLIELTHIDRVTHICMSKIIIIGSDIGLSPGRPNHLQLVFTDHVFPNFQLSEFKTLQNVVSVNACWTCSIDTRVIWRILRTVHNVVQCRDLLCIKM